MTNFCTNESSFSGLPGSADVASDVLLRQAEGSDESALALITPVPAIVWGAAWAAVSIAALAFTLRQLARGRALLVALLLLAPATTPADDTVLEVIPLKNRTAESLLPVLQPLAGPGATITGLDTRLIVRATPAALAEIRRVVATLDTPLRSLWITVDQATRGCGGRSPRTRPGWPAAPARAGPP